MTEPTIQEKNEAFARFMGLDIIIIGYYGQHDGLIDDETTFQKENKKWLDRMGCESIGRYAVNVKEDIFIDYETLVYHEDWNMLMRVWYKFLNLKMKDVMQQFRHGEVKTTLGHAILYGEISIAHKNLYEAILWYNSINKTDKT